MFIEFLRNEQEALFNAFRHRMEEESRARITPSTTGKNKLLRK